MRKPESLQQKTYTEFLILEERSIEKHEFSRGEILKRGGGSRNHALIGANWVRVLGNELSGLECTVFGSDLLVRIEEADAAFYPDAMVVCGKEVFHDQSKNAITNPKVVVEVLSPSTAAWDRGGKFRAYEKLASLQEYVLVEQDEAQIDFFRRNEDGFWQLERYSGMESVVRLECLGKEIAAKEIFRGVAWGEG